MIGIIFSSCYPWLRRRMILTPTLCIICELDLLWSLQNLAYFEDELLNLVLLLQPLRFVARFVWVIFTLNSHHFCFEILCANKLLWLLRRPIALFSLLDCTYASYCVRARCILDRRCILWVQLEGGQGRLLYSIDDLLVNKQTGWLILGLWRWAR